MDRLISLEPSNMVTIRIEPGERCCGSTTLRNVMHTMPVAFRLQPVDKTRYTIVPNSGIIPPLSTFTIEITYHLPQNSRLPESFPHSDDSFVLQSVVTPCAAFKNLSATRDSVPSEWFTTKKKQVYSDIGIKIMFVGSSILACLVAKGCMNEMREVLENSDPEWRAADSVNSDGKSLLHLAIARSRPDLVQLLLEFQADTEACGKSGSSPVEAAASLGEALIVELLLAHKTSTERSKFSNFGPIHLASGNGHTEVLNHLLLKGADVNAFTKDGNSALHIAVGLQRWDTVRLLLANSAKADTKNAFGDTPLHLASSLGDEQMVKLLLYKGANKDVRNKKGKTPYDLAAENGNTKLFDALRLGDKLCAAARKGELRTINRLLEDGACIDGRDQNSWTALHRAAFKGRTEVARALIEEGIDINSKDEDGYSALHCAVESGHCDVIELLVRKRADVDARTNKGVTALQIAVKLNHSRIIKILKTGVTQSFVPLVEGNGSGEMNIRLMNKKKINSNVGIHRRSFDPSEPLAVV
ncbi:protein VAPYRIN-like [Primulina eburnea]|uniref:protein VAPYRIN-like n=1 Tax=Primulina eburnea TaxID=1245227 RepID=UPI003C6C3C77